MAVVPHLDSGESPTHVALVFYTRRWLESDQVMRAVTLLLKLRRVLGRVLAKISFGSKETLPIFAWARSARNPTFAVRKCHDKSGALYGHVPDNPF